MNNKHYVGKQISSFERYDDITITGIALLVDDENEYLAGDDSGYLLEISCPYGTQTMANNLLASLQGKTYRGFRAENASLSPAAELGDGVTVNGVYSLLAYRNVEFGPGHMAEIAAPGEGTLEHEYKWDSPEKRAFNRKIAQTRSLISKTAEEIRLEVFGEDGAFTTLSQTVDGIALEVHGADGKGGLTGSMSSLTQKVDSIELSVSSEDGSTTFTLTADGAELSAKTLELSVDAANITGKLTAGQIETENLKVDVANITGKITFENLDEELQSDIENAGGISEEQAKTLITKTLVSSPTIMGGKFYDIDGVAVLDLSVEHNEVSVPGLTFSTVKVNSNGDETLDKNIFYIWPVIEDASSVGFALAGCPCILAEVDEYEEYLGHFTAYGDWNFGNATVDFGGASADDLGITFNVPEPDLSGITVSEITSGDSSVSVDSSTADMDGAVHCVFRINGTSYMTLGADTVTNAINFRTYPGREINLGTAGIPWAALYADSCSCCTSDENKKNSIEELPEKYLVMFDNVHPKRFKMNNGTSGRYHAGYTTQDVKAAMDLAGVDSTEFGGWIKDTDEDGNDVYMLRYEEFGAIYAAKIKQLEARVAKLEGGKTA